MAGPLFSVVVPAYNRAALLRQALASIEAQRFRDFEVIVVDDGSTDDTAAVAASFRPGAKVLRIVNSGPAEARNQGAAAARGRYLAFLDSDDLFFPWTLATYAEIAGRTGMPSFIAGKPFRFEQATEIETAEIEAAGESGPACLRFPDYLASTDEWRWWGASSFVIAREAFARAGGFWKQRWNAEDADLALRLGTAPGFVQVTAPATFAYRMHQGSLVAASDRTLSGGLLLAERERAGEYPGGAERRVERWRALGRHLRPMVLEALRNGRKREAAVLFRQTLAWNARLGRWRFIAAFPFLYAAARQVQ
jgi:hypothetical protein